MDIDIEQEFDVADAKPAVVTTYDYYKTGKQDHSQLIKYPHIIQDICDKKYLLSYGFETVSEKFSNQRVKCPNILSADV